MTNTGSEWPGRLCLVLGGLALAVALLEGALWAAALVVRVSGRPLPITLASEGRRVLATGDSNTYGLYLEPEQAYPLVFERLWNARHPEHPVEVLNVGYPGTNTSRLRNALPRFLESAKPDVVTIMVGANDFWTEPEPVPRDVEASPEHGGPSWLWRHSRVYRLLYMGRRAAAITLEGRVRFAEGAPPRGRHRTIPDASRADRSRVAPSHGACRLGRGDAPQPGWDRGAGPSVRRRTGVRDVSVRERSLPPRERVDPERRCRRWRASRRRGSVAGSALSGERLSRAVLS